MFIINNRVHLQRRDLNQRALVAASDKCRSVSLTTDEVAEIVAAYLNEAARLEDEAEEARVAFERDGQDRW